MVSVAYSLFFWVFLTVTSIACSLVAAFLRLATGPFDPRLRMLHRFTSWWGSLYIWSNPFWKVSIEGEMPPDRPYVMVANHQSTVDIGLLFCLPLYYKWVSKAENFRVPFIGWSMSLNRYIKIRRGTVSSTLRMMRDCDRALREGNSVMIFPEGTRSKDGKLRPFKDGAFELAVRHRVPVLPIVIKGSMRALPRRGFVLGRGCRITVRVLEALEPATFEGLTASELRNRVRAIFEGWLGE